MAGMVNGRGFTAAGSRKVKGITNRSRTNRFVTPFIGKDFRITVVFKGFKIWGQKYNK
jgi:hypothetical protein